MRIIILKGNWKPSAGGMRSVRHYSKTQIRRNSEGILICYDCLGRIVTIRSVITLGEENISALNYKWLDLHEVWRQSAVVSRSREMLKQVRSRGRLGLLPLNAIGGSE